MYVSFHGKPAERVTATHAGDAKLAVEWSCVEPGLVLPYVITAHGEGELQAVKSGSIKEGSAWWCRQTLRYEARARREAEARNRTFTLAQFAQLTKARREEYVVHYLTSHPDNVCFGGRPTPQSGAENIAGPLAELRPGVVGQQGSYTGSQPIGAALRQAEAEMGC